MDPEDRFERIERQMEFIVNQQAENSATIARHSEQIKQLGDFLLQTARFVEGFARRTDEHINALIDAQLRIDDRVSKLIEAQHGADERINCLAAAQQRTEERIHILINVVERYFSNGKRQ